MKTPFSGRVPSFDLNAIQATIQRALRSAGLDTRPASMDDVIEVAARVVPTREDTEVAPDRPPQRRQAPQRAGRFEAHSFSNAAGSRAYKVYVPSPAAAAPRAVMVMLHGCTQSADDFAAGTQMNRLAEELGFIVVYPEQGAQANPSKCWNWFKPQDQQREAGEPSLIAGITREVVQREGADGRRIFVAGLSAGAAMAVVLGESYPELFAGVGAHSGLPYGSAHDIPSALAAMKGGRSGLPGLKATPGPARRGATQAVPLIVFHGDRDHTVQPSNGADIVQQARQAHGALAGGAGLRATTQTGVAAGGQRYSRTVHADASGQARIESWALHGAGHAWSGGHASGSYTDARGPDASAEMLRFFMALPRSGAA